MARSNWGEPIFKDDRDGLLFLEEDIVGRYMRDKIVFTHAKPAKSAKQRQRLFDRIYRMLKRLFLTQRPPRSERHGNGDLNRRPQSSQREDRRTARAGDFSRNGATTQRRNISHHEKHEAHEERHSHLNANRTLISADD
jgi:hypothetical protein